MLRARAFLLKHRVEVLLGLGGAITLPAVLAARSASIRVCLLEINAKAGAATRYLAPFAEHVLHAWPLSVPKNSAQGPGARHVVSGPPLAPSFQRGKASAEESEAARRSFGLDPTKPVLLVLGGSQGALSINRFLREAAGELLGSGVQLLHQVGPGRMEEAAFPSGEKHSGYHAFEYIDDVAAALAAATCCLCRGGASTLAELAARGVPAWVVPYPHHKDRHQEANARALGKGVRILNESELGRDVCVGLQRLCATEGAAEREAMGAALLASVPPDAGQTIARALLDPKALLRTG